MQRRQNALNKWVKNQFGSSNFTIQPLAGDASFRRYLRIYYNNQSYVLMDAPPEKEDIKPFLQVGKILANIGIYTPKIHACEHQQGFLLLEDLGDQLLLSCIGEKNADDLYKKAISILIQLQQCDTRDLPLPHFNEVYMKEELNLFRVWFLDAFLNLNLSKQQNELLDETFDRLIAKIMTQPQVVIHRDYHSRNLLVVPKTDHIELGVIDYQDAMIGPFTYDLVSLLKDCYIQWPHQRILAWLEYFYRPLSRHHDISLLELTHAFDACGLQRHLKVLGIFCRLHLRDQKSGYLKDLPLAWHYLLSTLANYAEFNEFYNFMHEKAYPIFKEKYSLCTQQ